MSRGVVTHPPGAQPRAGIGEWPVWGDEPPELRFRQAPPARTPVTAAGLPAWHVPVSGARPAASTMAVAGFILGLAGAFFSWLPVVGLGCALFGAVLSVQGRRLVAPGHPGRALPTAGLVLGCIGIVFGVAASAVFATVALNALLNAAYSG